MYRPVGQQRSVAVVIILSIVTLGIYNLYWQYVTFKEMKDFGGEGIGGLLGLVLAILLGVVNLFILPAEVGNLYASRGRAKPVSGVTGLWNLLPIVGWIVWSVKVQGALNQFWLTHAGDPVAV